MSPRCVAAGVRYAVPTITITSDAGIRRILVTDVPKPIRSITFKGNGPTQFALKGLGVSTVGLSSGGHVIVVKVTDVKGKTASKTLRFSICVSTPVFTG